VKPLDEVAPPKNHLAVVVFISRQSGFPVVQDWIPAYAGMTFRTTEKGKHVTPVSAKTQEFLGKRVWNFPN